MESLQSVAFHALALPNPDTGLSILHSVCIEANVNIAKFILGLSPSSVDTMIAATVEVLSTSGPSEYKGKKLNEILSMFDTSDHESIKELLKSHSCVLPAKASLIHLAAREGDMHHIRKLIARGADVVRPSLQQCENYSTVLNHAAKYNSLEVVQELLQHGASLQAKDYQGFNAIHYAAWGGKTDTVLYMLNMDASLRDAVGQGYTPLHLAAFGGHNGTVETLIARGSAVNVGRETTTYAGIEYDVYPECDFCGGLVDYIGELTSFALGSTPIMLAAAGGQLKTVELLEEKGCQINNSILVPVARGGSLALLQKFHKAGLDFQYREKHNETLLHHVGNGKAAQFLIDHGLDARALNNHQQTPLHHAAYDSKVDVADVLIKHGADVCALDDQGNTPLDDLLANEDPAPHVVSYFIEQMMKAGKEIKKDVNALLFAQRFGPDVAKILLDSGLNVNHKSDSACPLLKAAEGNSETVRVFLEHGADVHVKDSCGCTPLHKAAIHANVETLRLLLAREPNLLHAVNGSKATALHEACHNVRKETPKAVEFLLEQGSDIMAVRNDGNTALHEAVNNCSANKEVVEVLLKYYASREADGSNSITTVVNNAGCTALHEAAYNGQCAIIKLLLDYGFSINAVANDGSTPLHFAVDHWTHGAFKLLLEHGADTGAVDAKGNTILHRVCASCCRVPKIIEIIFNKGLADVNSRNATGKTPLHLCAEAGRENKIMLLLRNDADLEAVDNKGCTPLHYAVVVNPSDTMRTLIERGANLNAANNKGNTPLHVAALKNRDNFNTLSELGDVSIKNKKGETPNDIVPKNTNN